MTPLRAMVVGVRGIGKSHAATLQKLPEYEVIALCDRVWETARAEAEKIGASPETSFREAIRKHQIEVVVIATPNDSHADLAMEALDEGVKGIFCEKPMAVHLRDARTMVKSCREKGVALAVNHQRRMMPAFREMRRLMDVGTIGQPTMIKASCAGDLMSDGTHTIDCLRFLAHDRPVEWVRGQVFGIPKKVDPSLGHGFEKGGGRRFGHIVEEASMGVIQFEGGLRAEIMTGDLFHQGRFYQDFEVFGEKGRIWRKSDPLKPNLLIQDDSSGGFREVEFDPESWDPAEPLRLFAKMIHEGAEHPLSGDQGLAAMEIITALYESARTREAVQPPCTQANFPLEMMS